MRRTCTSRWLGFAFASLSSLVGLTALRAEPHSADRPAELTRGTATQASAAPSRAVPQRPRPQSIAIQERYPNGAIKVQRTLVLTADGYVDHGRRVQYDRRGNVIGGGQSEQGKHVGHWVRVFEAGEGEIFKAPHFRPFQAPFTAEADFVDGRLQGVWSIRDDQGRTVCLWQFEQGQRQGTSVWYHANGRKAREVNYAAGVMDGDYLEWDADEKPVRADTCLQGRRHTQRTLWFSAGHKKAEGWVLKAEQPAAVGYDWWNGIILFEPTAEPGVTEKFGPWTWWHPNGEKYCEGHYLADKPVGHWTFWHANGQKHVAGDYRDGVEVGPWPTWDENGVPLTGGGRGGQASASDLEPAGAALKIEWFTDLEAAARQARSSRRPLLIFVTSTSCPPCSIMRSETYQDAAVAEQINAAFVPVLVDGDAAGGLLDQLHVTAYPTTVVVSPEARLLAHIRGYVPADQLRQQLTAALEAPGQVKGR